MTSSTTTTSANAAKFPTCAELRERYPRIDPLLPPHGFEWRRTDEPAAYLVEEWKAAFSGLVEILGQITHADRANQDSLYGIFYAMRCHYAALDDVVRAIQRTYPAPSYWEECEGEPAPEPSPTE